MRYSVLCLVACLVLGVTADAAPGLKVEVPAYEEPEDNAFDHYLRAAELLPADGRWNDLAGRLDEADFADLEATVLDAQEALEQLRLGIGKPCVIPGQVDFTTPFPYLAGFRSLARLLMREAWMYAELGDFGAAFGSCQDALTLGQDCARNGTLVHKLVSIACEAIACSQIRKTVGLGRADQQELSGLISYLGAFEAGEVPLSETFAVEYDGARRSLEKARTDKDMRALLTDGKKILVTDPLIDDALAQLEPYYARVIAIAKTDYWRWARDEGVPPGGNSLLNLIVPAVARTRTKVTRHHANLRGTLLVVALELHFARKGEYPRTLQELVPEVIEELPIDPFCGEPLRYALLDVLDYQLYSVGENMVDDGGREESTPGAGDGDILFSTMK